MTFVVIFMLPSTRSSFGVLGCIPHIVQMITLLTTGLHLTLNWTVCVAVALQLDWFVLAKTLCTSAHHSVLLQLMTLYSKPTHPGIWYISGSEFRRHFLNQVAVILFKTNEDRRAACVTFFYALIYGTRYTL